MRQGKALYAGISNYPAELTRARRPRSCASSGTPCLIHQPKYSMFERWIEQGLLDVLEREGIGCIAFSPLAQGLLTDRYLKGIPADSRAGQAARASCGRTRSRDERVGKVRQLDAIARARGQSARPDGARLGAAAARSSPRR